jgi:hypothetical protein
MYRRLIDHNASAAADPVVCQYRDEVRQRRLLIAADVQQLAAAPEIGQETVALLPGDIALRGVYEKAVAVRRDASACQKRELRRLYVPVGESGRHRVGEGFFPMAGQQVNLRQVLAGDVVDRAGYGALSVEVVV